MDPQEGPGFPFYSGYTRSTGLGGPMFQQKGGSLVRCTLSHGSWCLLCETEQALKASLRVTVRVGRTSCHVQSEETKCSFPQRPKRGTHSSRAPVPKEPTLPASWASRRMRMVHGALA